MSTTTRGLPFRQFVLKVHSRCDLACDHCYVYEHADQSWRARPKAISEATATRVAQRIAEHASHHQLPVVHVVLHGGEPLLLGIERTRSLLSLLRTQIDPVTTLDLHIHTNGIQLDPQFCALFRDFDVKVGVSLDGDRAANDRHRRFASGRTSHPQVLRALELLRQPEFAHLYAGILCTIDIQNNPITVYEAIAEQRPPRVDLLLPHATWDCPPTRTSASPAEYARWLTTIYARWTADGRPFGIRTFDSILAALRGEPSQTESLGLTPSDLLVIETDGSIEQADSLKTAFDGAPATGLDIARHSFDDAARHQGIEARQQGLGGLCDTCRACPVVNVCGGGLYAHRFRTGTGFANPSVYCSDLKETIVYINNHRPSEMAAGIAHTLPTDDFDTLASGHGSAGAVARLVEAQDSIRRSLIADLIEATRSDPAATAAGDLLRRLDLEAPEAFSTVLAHPSVRSWATTCLDALKDGSTERHQISYMNNLALAVAARARTKAQLGVTVVNGAVRLPTVGHADFSGRGDALVTIEGSRMRIANHDRVLQFDLDDVPSHAAWHPVTLLSDVPGMTVYLDADESDAKMLQRALPEAIDMLGRRLPEYLPGLRTALHTVVAASAPFHDTVGAISLVPSIDPSIVALRLLRSFQRVKLRAVFDLFKLVDSPRGDEEPPIIEDLLYEAYEDLAVGELHRACCEPFDERVADTVEQLSNRHELTDLGRRFVTGMARATRSWPTSVQVAP